MLKKQVGGRAFFADVCAGCRCRQTLQTAVAGRLRVALVDLKARVRSDTAGLRLSPAPVRKSLLRLGGQAYSPARHEQQAEFVRRLDETCRALYPDLHRCACQCPGLGMTMFFPGQRPLPDGHGVHSLPPPPRMYEPSWQGRHWPARGAALVREARRQAVLTYTNRVECRAIPAPRSPPPTRFCQRNPSRSSSHPFL